MFDECNDGFKTLCDFVLMDLEDGCFAEENLWNTLGNKKTQAVNPAFLYH